MLVNDNRRKAICHICHKYLGPVDGNKNEPLRTFCDDCWRGKFPKGNKSASLEERAKFAKVIQLKAGGSDFFGHVNHKCKAVGVEP